MFGESFYAPAKRAGGIQRFEESILTAGKLVGGRPLDVLRVVLDCSKPCRRDIEFWRVGFMTAAKCI